MIIQVKGGDKLPNRLVRVILSIKHDSCKRESEGDDV